MKNLFKLILTISLFINGTLMSQVAPSCPTNSILSHNGSSINNYSLPNGPLNTILNNMPGGSGGLAVGPSFAFPAPNPTWWTTAGNPRTYWYYNNGGTWSNTGHQVGNNAAVNIGGGGGAIYNLVGASGMVYKYVGTGNGFFLNTLTPAFNGQGPYDVVCDLADNFFILKASPAAQQGIYCYNPQGVLTCSWSITGMIQQTAGGGFAILNTANPSIHKMYYNSNGTDYIGNMIPGSNVITSTVQPLPSGSDYASCALTIPTASIIAPLGATLTCSLPQIPLVAQVWGNASLGWLGGYTTPTTSAVSPTCGTITWSGPGIVSGQGTATINVNLPGIYSYTINGCNGCPGYLLTASITVVGQPGVINPVITAPTCVGGLSTMSVSPNTLTNTVLWSGPGIVGANNTYTISFNQPGVYTTTITGGACSGTASVLVNQTPTLNITSTSNTLCANNYNGSLNSITVTAGGATNYTWSSIGLTNTTSNTTSPITYTPDIGSTSGTISLIGTNGTCSNSATYTVTINPNPTITVSSGSLCQGTSITLTANGATDYTWSPSVTLSNNTGSMVISNTNTTTTYNVIGNSLGCFSQSQTSTVNVIPNPTVTVGPLTNTICEGTNITITANGATNYTWLPNVNLNINTGPVVIANPPSTITYTVFAEQNTCTTTAVYQVSVIPMPIIQLTAPTQTICQNSNITITANGANNYYWTPTNTTGNSILVSPNTTTTYSVVGSNGQCIGSAFVTINVVPFPNLQVSSNPQQVCQGVSTILNANGASNYIWSPSNSLSSPNTPMVTANPNVSTNYTITGYNSLGSVSCASTKEILITVIPQTSITVSPSVTICLGSSVGLSAVGGGEYSWSPFNTTVNGPNVTVTPSVTTQYNVIATNMGNCPSTGSILVIVKPLPIVDAGVDTTFNFDEPMHLNGIGTGTLTWIYGNGIICSVCPNTQIFPTYSGYYTILATNDYGCTMTDNVYITITKDHNIYIPNTFTPNGDGLNDVFGVKGTGIINFELNVFDRWGENIFQSTDIQKMWDGTYKGGLCKNDTYAYLLHYTSLDGKTHTKTGHVTLLK